MLNNTGNVKAGSCRVDMDDGKSRNAFVIRDEIIQIFLANVRSRSMQIG